MPFDSPPDSGHASVPSGFGAPITTSDMTGARSLLLLTAVLYFVGGSGFAILLFVLERKSGLSIAQSWPLPAGIFISAVFLPAMLVGLAAIIKGQLNSLRMQRAQFKSAEQSRAVIEYLQQTMSAVRSSLLETAVRSRPPEAAPNPADGAHIAPVGNAAEALTRTIDATNGGEILNLLTQLRDLALMTESQRLQRAAQLHQQRRNALCDETRQLISRQQWRSAADAIEKLRSMLPGDSIADELSRELAASRSGLIEADIAAVQGPLAQFMSVNAWDRVEEIVGRLEMTYPGEDRVERMVRDIRREQAVWRAEEFQRLMADFREAADQRRWRQACLVAQQLVERYPEEKSIEKIRGELGKLRNNADAQDRQEMEAEFKDLLNRHRYEECLAVAEKMISAYPDSKAAAELTKMLPKLHELIRQDRSRRQQSAGMEQK